jgi:tetratricopeptide (TPR) repeat protein
MQLYPSGTRIAGRYEVAGAPLVGGMGIVYLCFDHQEQRPIALKTFRPEFLPDRAARDRFLQEGETWVRLGKHPHIVHCYQVFQDAPRPEVYLALELIAKAEGRRDASLRAWLTPGRPLPVQQALLIALQIARGMAHATDTIPGFVHRDLKPENVLVGADRLSNAACQRVRVTDFGLARIPAAAEPSLSSNSAPGVRSAGRTQAGPGTPEYMAPEQWKRPDVNVQADIYAFGCILGEMLVGRMLVHGQPREELWRPHEAGQALSAVVGAPAVMREVLARCLAVEPGQRYAGWDAVEVALAAAYRTVTGQPPPEPEPVGAQSRAERVAAGWSYSAMGGSYLEMGNAQAALGYFQQAHQAGQVEGERRLEAAGLNHLGLTHAALGDARRAIGYYELALTIAREIGNRQDEGAALGNLGNASADLGAARRAVGYHEQTLAIHREIGDRRGEGADLSNLGEAYRQLGDVRRSVGYSEQALAIHREIGDRRGEGNDLSALGIAYANLVDAWRSVGYFEKALTIHREIKDRRGEGQDLNNLGKAYLQLRDTRRAGGYLEQALAINREIGDLNGVAVVSVNMARLYAQQGEQQRALPLAREAARLLTQIGHAEHAQQAQQFVAELERQGR